MGCSEQVIVFKRGPRVASYVKVESNNSANSNNIDLFADQPSTMYRQTQSHQHKVTCSNDSERTKQGHISNKGKDQKRKNATKHDSSTAKQKKYTFEEETTEYNLSKREKQNLSKVSILHYTLGRYIRKKIRIH